MNQLNVQDISLFLSIVNAEQYDFSLDFLKSLDIVPSNWQQKQVSSLNSRSDRIVFDNGIKLERKPDGITFTQVINDSVPSSLTIADVAWRYCQKLPDLGYRSVAIKPRRFVTFASEVNGAYQYISQQILRPSSWQKFAGTKAQAGINLVYNLENCQLRIGINEARLQVSNTEAIGAVLFAGSFNYQLLGRSPEERLQELDKIINNWHKDLSAYQEFIDREFLKETTKDSVSFLSYVS